MDPRNVFFPFNLHGPARASDGCRCWLHHRRDFFLNKQTRGHPGEHAPFVGEDLQCALVPEITDEDPEAGRRVRHQHAQVMSLCFALTASGNSSHMSAGFSAMFDGGNPHSALEDIPHVFG